MKKYLSVRQLGGEENQIPAVVRAYLTSVLKPSMGDKLGMCNAHELGNLAATLDLLIEGKTVQAMDVLATRFQCVETGATSGQWNLAKHMQVIGEDKVSSVDQGLFEYATHSERRDLRLQVPGKGKGKSETA